MTRQDSRPNILLVVLDAARRDALEPYGAPAGSTPSVAQLAERGSVLPEVYATGCWTAPSHASIFTGLMPRAAGLSRVPSPAVAKPVLESHRDRVLGEVLRRAGYRTGAVSANLWVSENSGFDTGFDDFVSVDTGRHAELRSTGARARLRWLAEASSASVDDGAGEVMNIFERWIDAARPPFYWFVNLIECHSPYLPPRPYGDISRLERLRAAEDARRYYTLDAIWRACVGGFDIPAATIERMRRMYRASIRYMDDWLGRLVERLDGAGLLDDTLVVVTSDHGENFGEGGLVAHGLSLDNRLVHVPFIAAGPGADGLSFRSLAELPRVLADVAGVDGHPWDEPFPAGFGVAQFDTPADADDPRVAEAVERWGLGEDAFRRFTEPLTCAVAGDLKLLRRGEAEELYDLGRDPLEVSPLSPADVAPERAPDVAALREALEHPAVSAVRSQAPTATAAAPSPKELREIEDRMKLLGYM
jgi:arylsulfatase A-like enzyme